MKKVKSFLKSSVSNKVAKATDSNQEVVMTAPVSTKFNEDMPKGLRIVAGNPVAEGSAEWHSRKEALATNRIVKEELSSSSNVSNKAFAALKDLKVA